jgi:hypothetical protein
MLICVVLSLNARAVSPAPDGGYPNQNTAEGDSALVFVYLPNSPANTAIGNLTLFNLTTGSENTAIGAEALRGSSDVDGPKNTGSFNTATGFQALYSEKDGGGNVADGWQALYSNTSGYYNTATGVSALRLNTSGFRNTAVGLNALYNNTGSNNVAVGSLAGQNLTVGNNNIDIGNQGVAGESGKIRIGTKGTHTATFIAGISGKTVASGVGVIVNSNGLLGTVQSSARFKDEIRPMDKASEAILALQPVTFCYKAELDPGKIPQFGLIAEDVEKVSPDLVIRDEEGKVSTVRYEAVNAMLLNEFLKEHRKVQELEATLARQDKEYRKKLTDQQTQVDTLVSAVEKVTAQIQLRSAEPQVAHNP